MKVIHSNKYEFVGIQDGWFRFESNPNLVNYDPEVLLVKRARYVQTNEDGSVTSNMFIMDEVCHGIKSWSDIAK